MRYEEEDKSDRAEVIERLREQLMSRPSDELLKTAKEYLDRGYFTGTAMETARGIIGTVEQGGPFTFARQRALAGLVAYINMEDEA